MRKYLSMFLKFIIVISSFTGIYLSVFSSSKFMSGLKSLMYFTIQSNIWIGIWSLFLLILMILELIKKKTIRKRYMYLFKQIFTVSITLTGVMYCFFLAPTSNSNNAWSLVNLLTHVIVPISSVFDFFIDDFKVLFKKKDSLLTLIPSVYYVFFALICYLADFKFSDGNNYPYFFLNFGSPSGMFGFSDNPLYFMGTFYWILAMGLLVLGCGLVFSIINNKINKK